MSSASSTVMRFCFVRLRQELAAQRDELCAKLRDELTAACAPHPVWTGVPGDDSAIRWDLAVTISLPDLAAWERLAGAPALAAIMDRLDGAAEVLKTWTFAQR
ncbi:MAG: hypothetical protein IPI49_07930 [Myxococcales bacterium]|jgi:hypothetical protein|nr:hypothetical protein [Myxococcales bacterium]HRC57159.1 hypothetical protein [Kofleriaceae bacterium]